MNFSTSEPDPAEIVDRLREAAGQLLLRRVIDRDDWIGLAVLDIAAGDRQHWTPQDWHTLLAELHRTPGKLSDWLDLNA